MRDERAEKDGGGRAALILGFGGKQDEASEGAGLMRAFARSLRTGNFDKAWSLFQEAKSISENEKSDNPFASEDEDDDEGGLAF